jgi:hypothetical protein
LTCRKAGNSMGSATHSKAAALWAYWEWPALHGMHSRLPHFSSLRRIQSSLTCREHSETNAGLQHTGLQRYKPQPGSPGPQMYIAAQYESGQLSCCSTLF